MLSDVQMPELDGFGLAAAVHDDDEDLPVLLMTGDPSLAGAVRAIDSGAVSYISKPFDNEALACAVARAARRHGVARMRRRAESFHRGLFGDAGSDDRARRAAAARGARSGVDGVPADRRRRDRPRVRVRGARAHR